MEQHGHGKNEQAGFPEPHPHSPEVTSVRISLAVQWFRLPILTAEGPGSTSGQGTKIPQAPGHSQEKKKVTSAVEEPQGFAGTIIPPISLDHLG